MKACISSENVTNLMIEFGNRTEKAGVKYVPYILFNDVYNKTVENQARDNFLETVCEMFGEKPTGC